MKTPNRVASPPTDEERMERNGPVEQAAQDAHQTMEPWTHWRKLTPEQRSSWRRIGAAMLLARSVFEEEEA